MKFKQTRRAGTALGRLRAGIATRHDRRQLRKFLAKEGHLPQHQVMGHQVKVWDRRVPRRRASVGPARREWEAKAKAWDAAVAGVLKGLRELE